MNQNVGEQINLVINNLAEKLGIAAEKVYPMLIKQAYVDGISSIIFIIIGLILCASPYIGLKTITKKNPDGEYIAEDWDDAWGVFFIISMVVVVLGAIFIFTNISMAINAFGNPEWYAIQSIINQLKIK